MRLPQIAGWCQLITRYYGSQSVIASNFEMDTALSFFHQYFQCPLQWDHKSPVHYDDVIMTTMAFQITSLTIVYSIVYSDADQRKHQSSASLAFVWVIHRGPVNSPHKWPATRKMFPFDDVIMVHLLVQPFVSANITKNIKACVTDPLWGKFTGHRWILLIKGQ